MGDLFEQLINGGGDLIVTGECYHWSSPEHPEFSRRNIDPSRSVSVSDEYYSWSNYQDGGRLYALTVVFRKPLVLLDQLEDFEQMFPYGHDSLYTKLVERGDFDAVVYTPHPYGRGVRQALIMHPHKQLLAIREMHQYNTGAIDEYQKCMHPQWRRLMIQPELSL